MATFYLICPNLNGWIFENANQISVWSKISNQVDGSNNYVVGN
jgi:hypothetical protein